MFKPVRIILYILISICTLQISASNLQLSQPILYNEPQGAFVVVNLSWEHAWHHQRNHDAAWLFFKLIADDGQVHHLPLSNEGHQQIANFSDPLSALTLEKAKDGSGLFVYVEQQYRGSVNATLKLKLNQERLKGLQLRSAQLQAFGIEMVHIPAGPFFFGSTNQRAKQHGAFYAPKAPGTRTQIKTEQALNIAPDGDLFYQNSEGYEGDQDGPLPAAFPKGTSSFYIMKYEISEGQYVEFLNSIRPDIALNRSPINVDKYYTQGGMITFNDTTYSTKFPQKPCRFLSWDNAMAFADWACLRPMTELEFTKAARGPGNPGRLDFPWGAHPKYQVQRLPDHQGRLNMVNGWDEAFLNDSTRVYFAASYYWVMDLSGSLWERLVSLGHAKGRSFKGTHGDGVLTAQGLATNTDWPTGDEDSGGVGFRGGGFYGHDREYHEYNPFSPISYRPYGGWHGTMPSIAYGTRLVRTQ